MSLAQCFERQTQLMHKFHAIELEVLPDTFQPANGFCFERADFISYMGQRRLRELAWRIQEETGEMLDTRTLLERPSAQSDRFLSEVADVFHFLCEFLIVIGITPIKVSEVLFPGSEKEPLEECFNICKAIEPDWAAYHPSSTWLWFLTDLSMAINLLKNRGWKKTPREVDIPLFHQKCILLLMAFTRACLFSGVTYNQLIVAYLNKANENDSRIRDGV